MGKSFHFKLPARYRPISAIVLVILVCGVIRGWEKNVEICRAFRSIYSNTSEKEEDRTIESFQRNGNVLLQGQFNYDTPPETVAFWVETWSKYFTHILVVGPFSVETTEELDKKNISYRYGGDDSGIVSPYVNLADTLLEYEGHRGIDGVLYMHDDMIINVSFWKSGRDRFPSDIIIRTNWTFREEDLGANPYQILTHNFTNTVSPQRLSQSLYYDPRDGTEFNNWGQMTGAITKWRWPFFKNCIPGQTQLMENEFDVVRRYLDIDGKLYFPGFWQADALYVPTMYAKDFNRAAKLLARYTVHLECAMPTIVYWVLWRQRGEDAEQSTAFKDETTIINPTRNASLCTTFLPRRGSLQMLRDCLTLYPDGLGSYHPLKPSMGQDPWKGAVEWAQRPRDPNSTGWTFPNIPMK